MTMADPFALARFVSAQAPVIAEVEGELAAGRKRSHWMWFVFPQLAGLGFSPMAQLYAIGSLAEAEAYLAHPLLGPRLVACTQRVNAHAGLSAHAIFGSPDDLKFRSCVTLFERTATRPPVFRDALDLFFDGEPDAATVRLLG